MMRRVYITASLGIWLLACTSGLFAQEVVEVAIKDYQFTPAELTIAQGVTVRWTNHEKRQYHNVWFEALGEKEPDYLFPDDSYERRFDEKGDFPYRCGPHPEMRGVIHVE